MKRLLALLLVFLASSAMAAGTDPALTFLIYGQSLAQGSISGDAGYITAGSFSNTGVLTVTTLSGAPPIGIGSALTCYTLPNVPPTVVTTGNCGSTCTGTGTTGTYQTNYSGSGFTLTSNCLVGGVTASTILTPSNINSNAFMITTSPLPGVRGMYGTLSSSNAAPSKPIYQPYVSGNWTGFSLLKEGLSPYNYNVSGGGGGIDTETMSSSIVAQFVSMMGYSSSLPIIAEDMAMGGEDWQATCPGCLSPGGANAWTDLVLAQKFIKENVQGSGCTTSCPGAGFTGPWTYHLGGVFMRFGESAASTGLSTTVGTTFPPLRHQSFLRRRTQISSRLTVIASTT